MDKFINVSRVFVNDIRRYIATFSEKKNNRFFTFVFFYLRIVVDLPRIPR